MTKTTFDATRLYRENALHGASPLRLVVTLYEWVIEDLRTARDAMQAKNAERGANAIRHAFLVLLHLQGTLDFERGGSVARQFEQFYNLVRAKVLEAQLKNSLELLEQQILFLSQVRDCWVEAEKILAPAPALSAPASQLSTPADMDELSRTVEWNA